MDAGIVGQSLDLSVNRVVEQSRRDRQCLVAEAVVMVPGPRNGEIVTAEAMSRALLTGEGVPVVIRHPQDEAGEFISARRPDVTSIGQMFNLRLNEWGALVADVWLDLESLRATSEGSLIEAAIRSNQLLEVSVGWYRSLDDGADGEPPVARDLLIDHLAILPDQLGACSVEDGCGIPRESRATRFAAFVKSVLREVFMSGKKAKVDKLAGFLNCQGDEAQRASLMSLPDQTLDGLLAGFEAMEAVNDDGLGHDIEVVPGTGVEDLRQQIAELTARMAELQGSLSAVQTFVTQTEADRQAAATTQRQELIDVLVQVGYDEADLETFSADQLGVLISKRAVPVTTFQGRVRPVKSGPPQVTEWYSGPVLVGPPSEVTRG